MIRTVSAGTAGDDLVKKAVTSAPGIGRYERNKIKPSVKAAIRIGGELVK